jgi:hypothetical protein
MTRRAQNSPARIVEQLGIKLGRLVEIIDLQDYSKKIGDGYDFSFRRAGVIRLSAEFS